MREWGGGSTDNLNINKRGVQIQGGGGVLKTFSLIVGVPNKTSFHHLQIVDTGATIRLNKIRKVNQSNFTITQSRNI